MKRKIMFFLILIFAGFVLKSNGQNYNAIDSLQKRLASATGGERIDILNELAYKTIDVSSAIAYKYSFEAIQLSRDLKDIDREILSTAYHAKLHLSAGSLDSGFNLIRQAIELLPQTKNKFMSAYVYMIRGRLEVDVYYYENAFQDFYNSYLVFEEIGDYENSTKTLMYLGNLFLNLNDFEAASEYINRALEKAKSHNLKSMIPVFINQNAITLFRENKNEEAIELCNQAIKLALETGNFDELITSYTYLGDYNVNVIKNYDYALAYYHKALDISEKIINNISSAMLQTKIAHVYMLKNELQAALEADKIALNLRILVGKFHFVGSSYTNVGSDFLKLGEYDSANAYLQKGIQIAIYTGRYYFQANTYKILSNLYLEQDDFASAYDYYVKYTIAKDSVSGQENSNEVSKFKFKYELTKKENELKELEISQQNLKVVFFGLLAIFLTIASIITAIFYLKNKKSNASLKNLSEQQELVIKQRTKELEYELTKQQKIQEEINKALEKEKQLGELKSRFVSMVSHEFRTPLTSINLHIEMLKRMIPRNDPVSIRKSIKHTDNIKNEIKRVTTLMEDILLRGKLEAGRMDFNPERVNIKEITEEIIENYRSNSGDIKIEFEISGQEKEIYADTKMMYLILSNLISNALKYSGKGKKIKVDLIFGKKDITISVLDMGIGIPEDEQHNLFESFYRARNAKDIKGYGLGLVITKQLIEMHKGKIEFKSRENEGTKFTVTIPENQKFNYA